MLKMRAFPLMFYTLLTVNRPLYGFRSFAQKLAGQHVLIKSDNTTAISYITNMGGMQSELCD